MGNLYGTPAVAPYVAALSLVVAAFGCEQSWVGGDATDDDDPEDGEDAYRPDAADDSACGPGLAGCGDNCVDLSSDHGHCGSCFNECEAVEVCSGGLCTFECPPGKTNCSGSCVDMETDLNNCGACGNACLPDLHATPVCEYGECKTICEEGWADLDHNGSCEADCVPTSSTETCNGLDDNCDGRIDEGFECNGDVDCGDDNACTEDSCSSACACEHTNKPDGTACGDDVCCSGVCRECCVNGDCNDANQCTDDTCESGTCSNTELSDMTTCDAGVCCDGLCRLWSSCCTDEDCPDLCSGTARECSTFNEEECESQSGCHFTGADECTGTPSACGGYAEQAVCEDCACTWFPFPPGFCSGSGGACDTFTDQATCASCGCSWISESGCAGTHTPCDEYSNSIVCNEQTDCHWDARICRAYMCTYR